MVTFAVRELSAGRGGRPLISGLSFELGPAGRVALVGRSGSGKTTVLRALAVLDDPIDGQVTLDGAGPDEVGIVRWRRRVALVAQRAAFFGDTVGAELARPFTYASADRPFDARRARALLERLGLADAWDRPAHELSEGERQRVALARALGLEPDVLLLDEPTSALDPESVARVEAVLEDVRAAIVLVTHAAAQRERLGAEEIALEGLRAGEGGRAR